MTKNVVPAFAVVGRAAGPDPVGLISIVFEETPESVQFSHNCPAKYSQPAILRWPIDRDHCEDFTVSLKSFVVRGGDPIR